MIIVGNIVTEGGLTGVPNNFNILSIEDYLKNPVHDLPTIFVGWDLTKTYIGEVSILKKKIKENLYWTFSSSEKRTNFENDLKKFINRSYDDYVKKIKFISIDPIIYKINNTEEFISKINNVAGGFAYLYQNKVVYVYNNFVIYSIDLEQLDFIGFDREIILSKLKELTNFSNTDELKNFKGELKHLNIKYLPYLIYATKNITPSLIPQE